MSNLPRTAVKKVRIGEAESLDSRQRAAEIHEELQRHAAQTAAAVAQMAKGAEGAQR